jgi:hypothetical protein
MLHPALRRALATAHIEDLHRDAAQRHTIRLARRVAHDPHLAGASDDRYLADGCGPAVATAVLAVTDFRCIER